MPHKSQIEKSLPDIIQYLNNAPIRAYNKHTFRDIFELHKYEWNIANKSLGYTLNYLAGKGIFIYTNIGTSQIFSLPNQDDNTIISGIKPNAYFTHYTAMFFHQLTLQIPKTVYLNFEHSASSLNQGKKIKLSQSDIDTSFEKPQRKSSASFVFNGINVIIINGKYTDKLGVIRHQTETQCFEYTDLERTLIDIVVRPVYAGGVFEVLEAFRTSREKLNVKKMFKYLQSLDYTYPYHQAIGFYLEKAGYKESDLKIFHKHINAKFYLTYNIRNKVFSAKWQLYYPKGF